VSLVGYTFLFVAPLLEVGVSRDAAGSSGSSSC
jgi:hypothetical protein